MSTEFKGYWSVLAFCPPHHKIVQDKKIQFSSQRWSSRRSKLRLSSQMITLVVLSRLNLWYLYLRKDRGYYNYKTHINGKSNSYRLMGEPITLHLFISKSTVFTQWTLDVFRQCWELFETDAITVLPRSCGWRNTTTLLWLDGIKRLCEF